MTWEANLHCGHGTLSGVGGVWVSYCSNKCKLATSCCCLRCICLWFCMRPAVIFPSTILNCVGRGPLLRLRLCTTCQARPWLKCTTTSSARDIPNQHNLPCSLSLADFPRQRVGEQTVDHFLSLKMVRLLGGMSPKIWNCDVEALQRQQLDRVVDVAVPTQPTCSKRSPSGKLGGAGTERFVQHREDHHYGDDR